MQDFNKFSQFRGTRLITVIALSALVSLLLWGHYKVNDSVEVTLPAEILCNVSDPLKYTAFTCLTNSTEEIREVKLVVVCSKLDMDLLRAHDFALHLDLENETQANVIPAFEVKTSQARYIGPAPLKSKFKVVSVEPKRLRVVVDNLIDRSLPVLVELKGEPSEGYTVTQTNIFPSFVSVKGPEALLSELPGVPTEPISIEGLNKNLDTYCSIKLPAKMECRHHTVRVGLDVSHAPKVLTLEKVAVERFGMPQKDHEAIFTPATVDIKVEVPIDESEIFDPKDIRAFVDVNNLAPDDYSLPVKVLQTKTGRVSKITPTEIKVSIKNSKTTPPKAKK